MRKNWMMRSWMRKTRKSLMTTTSWMKRMRMRMSSMKMRRKKNQTMMKVCSDCAVVLLLAGIMGKISVVNWG